MSEIRPALTAEEWANKEVGSADDEWRPITDVRLIDDDGRHDDGFEALLVANVSHDTVSLHGHPCARHAIAALALHGQAFGFTWDDVDELEAAASFLEATIQNGGGANKVRAIADRIAALLPPRERRD